MPVSLPMLVLTCALTLANACARPVPEPPAAPTTTTADTAAQPARSTDTETPPLPAAPPPLPPPSPRALIDRVWQVQSSSSLAPGTTYTFRGDGVLLIASGDAAPVRGRWRYDAGRLTTVVNGVTRKIDVLALDHERLRLRSRTPGVPVESVLVAQP